ncbi:class I SAM-dependent methyltransferase [Pseudonocardia parietis]|uniref:SAM-dependent methyltransferase n=1 Tax=Pseudonocardia parietis TaxID=570936 RepID=A0ABS4VLF8_9PSEU|nr:class I SAM-dependent methyltransferase [Pseudonocardia parietis]MBP2364741.1 SAM-dependent methyltransferase [Pseudonocardia parietis]
MRADAPSPLYDRVLAGAVRGARLLDVGCGAGHLLARAAADGLEVSGVDVAREALAAAGRLVPHAVLQTGDAQALPFGDDAFDLVTMVQVLEHLTDPVLALREAGRVCAPGGAVRATVWGTPDECDASVIGAALAPLTGAAPAPRQDRPPGIDRSGTGAPPLTGPDRLAELCATAGLVLREIAVVRVPADHPDADDLVAGALASGPGRHAARAAGPAAVRTALVRALEPFRVGDGYRLTDTVRVLDAALH